MFAQAHYPIKTIPPSKLDDYLNQGWFRTGQTIFTCTFLHLNNEIYRAFWLRVVLDEFKNDKAYNKLLKLNSKFDIRIQQATITREKEALYTIYKKGIAFDPADSLQTLLNHDTIINIYNTLEIELYDGNKLIGVGFFDLGNTSAAGINCFYNPEYKKYSIGKYLIYQKIQYCKNIGMQFFYLGYFGPGCKPFDYKLDIAKNALEYFDLPTQSWFNIKSWSSYFGSINETIEKLADLKKHLDNYTIENNILNYQNFQANIIPSLHGMEFFDYFQFIYCFNFDTAGLNLVIVYDFRDNKYHLLYCVSLGIFEDANDQPDFSKYILKIKAEIFSTTVASEMAEVIVRAFPNGLKSN